MELDIQDILVNGDNEESHANDNGLIYYLAHPSNFVESENLYSDIEADEDDNKSDQNN